MNTIAPIPRLSVVVPVFNSASYLPLSAPALLDQDLPREDFELIFVDNNSTDGSAALLGRWASRITVLSETSQGAYSARNLGVRAARGQILVFTDPDCVPCAGWLQEVDKFMREKPAKVMLGPRRFATDSFPLSALADYESAKDAYMARCRRMEVIYGFANNMAIRQEAFAEFGPFDALSRGSDTLFLRKVVRKYGYGSLAFEESMVVRHLEIDSVRKYFSKVVTYAASRKRNQGRGTAKPLSVGERLRVWRNSAARSGYGFSRRVWSLGLLALGAALWKFSSWRASSNVR